MTIMEKLECSHTYAFMQIITIVLSFPFQKIEGFERRTIFFEIDIRKCSYKGALACDIFYINMIFKNRILIFQLQIKWGFFVRFMANINPLPRFFATQWRWTRFYMTSCAFEGQDCFEMVGGSPDEVGRFL